MSGATTFRELVDACVGAARRQSNDGVSWTGLNPPDGEAVAGSKPDDATAVAELRNA
jgi:hypothetical protein